MTSRQRSSSARSNNSDNNARQTSTPSPSHYPQASNGSTVPEDLVLNDVPTYGRSTGSNLLIPSQGIGSPYPSISGGVPPSAQTAAQRPRANTDQAAGLLSTNRPLPYRAGARGQIPLEYIQGQRFASNPQMNPPYIPGPPQTPQQQNHMMNLPPPPPRPSAINISHNMVPPPPPGPPPSATTNNGPTGWPQQGWGRQQSYLPPPPPLGPSHVGAQMNPYPQHPTYRNNQPGQLSIPPPPPQNEAVVSATYIPGGDSFGPGVGIPALYSQKPEEPSIRRDDSFSYSATEAKMLADQRFFNGPTSAISPATGGLPTFSEHVNASVPQTPLTRHHPTPFPNEQAQTPASAIQDGTPTQGHHHTNSTSSALLSPNDPALQWPLDRVLIWLAGNGFSNDWQETFKGLDMHSADFLDLGRGNGGRGNFGMMHQVVYPRLARECSKSGTGWDQGREREEGKRMRRLVRRIVEGADVGPKTSHGRRESQQIIPKSASTDGGVENSPNLGRQDAFAFTPSTAGGGQDSPSSQFRTPAPNLNPRMGSKALSSTSPIPAYAYGNNPSTSDPALHEMTQTPSTRTGFTRGILNNINDAASKRHSPNVSSETGAGSTFIGDAVRSGYDASPQNSSPATQHAQLVSSTPGGTLSAPPYGRPGHRKTEMGKRASGLRILRSLGDKLLMKPRLAQRSSQRAS